MAEAEVYVIKDNVKCREVVQLLEKCDVISVDAEGVQLGKDGPMTLLQIGTLDNEVYLFDVKENPELFTRGNLKSILTSSNIVKVIHSCSGDSAALYFQFCVHLKNVFDTQVAHIVIEEHKGTVLPPSLKLKDICTTYSQSAKVSDLKDDVKETWVKRVGDYWARRPLTEEMIDYAAGDVTALIPEVYETQKSYIENNGLWQTYMERVEEEINIQIDDKMHIQRRDRVDNKVQQIISDFPERYTLRTTMEEIENEDDKRALNRIRYTDAESMHRVIKHLKTKSIEAQLDDFMTQIDEAGTDFMSSWRSDGYLRSLNRHPSKEIQQRAKLVRDRINHIRIADIGRKYGMDTSLYLISKTERDALQSIRPKGVKDPRYPDIVLRLYWEIQEKYLDETIERLQEEGQGYTISDGYMKKIKYYSSSMNVPASVKCKAKTHLQNMSRTFGRREKTKTKINKRR